MGMLQRKRTTQTSLHVPRIAVALILAFAIASCSFLKLDKNTNCLNESAGCFRNDVTRPTLTTSFPEVTAAGVAELPYVDLTFSEELKGGDVLDNYSLSGAGASAMSLSSVTKTGKFTYRIYLNGAVNNGAIRITFSKLSDYAGNTFASQPYIEYEGNTVMVVNVTAEHNRGGVSTNAAAGGYAGLRIRFSHNYRSDPTNNTSWFIRITPGIVDCAAGTAWHNPGDGVGSNLPHLNTADLLNTELVRDFVTADFTNPFNAIVICMTNNTNPSAKATGVWYVRRNDTAPVMSYIPPETDYYNSPVAVQLTCSGYPARIAVTETSQQTTSPPNPATPAFDANTGAVTTGSSFAGGTATVTAQNPANPTRTKFSWRCIDVSGNMSTLTGNSNIEYYVDTTIPAVNVTLDASYRSFVSATGYTSTTLKFTTDQPANSTWLIKKGGTSCTVGGTIIHESTVVAPGVPISHTINVGANATTDFNVVGVYPIRICVHRAANDTWGTAFLQVTRDDTAPTIASSVVSGSYGAVQHVALSCTDNEDVIAHTKEVQLGKTAPVPGNPQFLSDGSDIVTGSITLDDSSTTIIRYQCRDKAGNFSSIEQLNYTIDATLPNITVVSNERSALSAAGGFATSQLVWRSTRGGLPYEIRRGVADCSGGPGLGNANNILTGTTPTDLSNISVTLNAATHFTGNGTYGLKICVFNYIDAPTYQPSTLDITRDDSPPATVTGLTVTAATTTSVTLGWTAATDPGASASGVGGYRIYQRTSAGSYSPTTYYTSNMNTVNISGLSATETYFFVVRAIDNAGNLSAADSNEVQSKLVLSVSVAGYTAFGGTSADEREFRVRLGTETLAFTGNTTQSFSRTFLPGETYSVSIENQPIRQNCAFTANQYGTLTATLNLQVTCVAGFLQSGQMTVTKPAHMGYHLLRGSTVNIAGGATPGGIDCTGSNIAACKNGSSTASQFNSPHGITIMNGAIYVADRENNRIRSINTLVSPAVTTTFAGEGTPGTSEGIGTSARINKPQGITTDGANLYVVESPDTPGAGHILRINMATAQVTRIAGGGSVAGGTPCTGSSADECINGTGLQAKFFGANDIKYHKGYLYISEYSNRRIRRMSLATGAVETIAGEGSDTSTGDGGAGISATFRGMVGMAIVSDTMYVVDFNGHRIRSVSLAPPYTVNAVAGSGTMGYADGPAAVARFTNPDHIYTDGRDLYVTEYGGNRVRRINLVSNTVSTVAGNGTAADASGSGLAAGLNGPVGIISDGRRLHAMTYTGGRLYQIRNSGLAGYWPLNGQLADLATDAGITPTEAILSDSDSPTAPTLLPAAGRFGPADADGAYTFDGINDVIVGGGANLPTGGAERTLCAWFKPAAIPNGFRSIAAYGSNSSDGLSFGLTLVGDGANATLKLHLRGATADLDAANVPIAPGVWSHACGTYSAPVARLYFNGKLVAQGAPSPAPATAAGTSMQIGRYVNNGMYFQGSIADVRVYIRALNTGEIHELAQYAAPAQVGATFSSGATGLLSHYAFTGSALTDYGALGRNFVFGTAPAVIGVDGDTQGAFHYAPSNGDYHATVAFAHDGLGAGGQMTAAAWINPASLPTSGNLGVIVSRTPGDGTGYYLELYNSGGTQTIYWTSQGSASATYANYTVPLNAWTHVAVTHTSSAATIYVNGVAQPTTVSNGPVSLVPASSSTPIYVGRRFDGYNFPGKIDDIRIYNNALSASQVRQLAAQVPAGLVFRMDTVGDANDVSGLNQALVSNTGALAAGRHGVADTAYRFTSGQVATFAHSTTLNTPNMTWSFWMKSPSMTGGDLNTSIIRKFQTFNADGWVVKYDHINYLHNYKASSSIQSAHESLVNNVWTHYTVVRSDNGASDNIYINGQSALNNAGLGANVGNTAQMIIGANGTADMTLQDVRIYNRVLDPSEVRALSGYHPNHGVSGMVFHVQADNYSHLTDGALISTNWQDSTIRDRYTATGGVPTGSPKFVSGASSLLGKKPAIEFDGVDGKYFDFGNTSVTYNGLTVCAALTRRGLGFGGLVEKRGGFQANSWGMITENAANAMKFEIGDPPGANVVDTVTDDSPSIYCMVNGAGNAIQTFVNGQLASTVGGSTLIGSNTRPLLVGARYDYAGSYHGQIGDIVIAVKDASTAERRVTECYLASKYSIPLATGAVCP